MKADTIVMCMSKARRNLGATALGSGDDGLVDQAKTAPIGRVGETDAYGFEVEAHGDCFYQFEMTRDQKKAPGLVRIYFTSEEPPGRVFK